MTYFFQISICALLASLSLTTLAQSNGIQSEAGNDDSEVTTESVVASIKDIADIEDNSTNKSLLDQREENDSKSNKNPFSISQHRPNYLLPFSYLKSPNPTSADGFTPENIDNKEAKYQISIKVPLLMSDDNQSGLYFGFTAKSFWQVYNSEVSKPFRETNYEPELFYRWKTDYSILGYRFNMVNVGINHQSNGQSGLRSRSWNRITASAVFSDKDSLYYIRTWYRIPENEKADPLDPTGDDNPDISDFVGRVELGYAFEVGEFQVMSILRNNLSMSRNLGSIELNALYPINDRYDWLIQYFNGYGDSLIDYNRSQERISVGFQLRFL